MEQYDVAVVGLGALGSAAAYQASIKGAKVVGFEQFELGHVRGASHDTSRIVRTSYGAPEFVALARSAYKDWAELERRSGMKMLTITGGVVFLPQKGPTPSSDFTTSLDANGVPYEVLTPEETNKRWPGFNVPQGVDTVFTPDSGIVHAAKAVMTLQFQARFNGAVLKENTRVEAVTPQPSGGVTIETSQGVYHARKVIIAADAWTNKLLKPLGPSREHEAQFANDKFPVWIWGGEKWFYGFPLYGEPALKAGQDAGRNDMNPEERTWRPSERLSNELNGFLDRLIPKRGDELRTVTCQYTITPDRQFIISELEKHKDVILALGNAHAFKFAPAIGRVTAELALDGKTTDDISKFGFPKTTPSKL
ncbi:Monomeric sarcosine oxidase [Fusarium oxysporum f. sp. raphani]|uniref:sarcosine oxidasee (formaldehyde-forming) n=1 Tax=Fusarium oxysporum f. sp. raphani TaxID=96318 RepID=A0A8J5QA09_FUSOX|nr:Monomeric sarcosine oxidase [Fusarium oxysporum f. sp. raphani]